MYLSDTKTGEAMQGDGLFQPKFDPVILSHADRLEIWGTGFEDAGEYCEFRLMKGDEVIATRTIQGY